MITLWLYISLIGAAITALLIAVWAFNKPVPGSGIFAALLLSIGWWLTAFILELSSTTVADALIWRKLQYLSMVAAPPLWLAFALRNGGHERFLTRPFYATLFCLALLTLAMVWTNERHGLVWSDATLTPLPALQILSVNYGPWLWLHTLVAYSMVMVASAILVRAAWRLGAALHLQLYVLICGVLIPLLGNIASFLRLGPLPYVDLTPLLFILGGIFCAWAIYRTRFLAIVPVARNVVMEDMRDGVLVIDGRGAIVDINRAGQQLFAVTARSVLGRPLAVVPPLAAIFAEIHKQPAAEPAPPREIEMRVGNDQRIFEMHTAPLHAAQGLQRGLFVVLRDVTDQKRIERELSMQQRLLAGVVAVAQAASEHLHLSTALHNTLHVIMALTCSSEGSLFLIAPDGSISTSILSVAHGVRHKRRRSPRRGCAKD
ncbi:PAS domain-containing protein [Candidatus Gracilibacteria bacterium]|nr:PAS domain-containing protein [Candidatus Gracilibacteria bacterium]